jgi:hypothetical protein
LNLKTEPKEEEPVAANPTLYYTQRMRVETAARKEI